MKKYIFGLFAIVFAVCLSAFTSPVHKTDTKYFKFQGSRQIDYVDPDMWVASDELPSACIGTATACIVSSESLVDENDLTDFLINSGGTARDANTNYGIDYHVEGQRAAVEP